MALDLSSFRLNAVTAARSATAAAIMLGGMAFAARAETPARAEPVVLGQDLKPLLSQRECVGLLSRSSTEFLAAGQGKDKTYNPEFPETLAQFIAPSNPKPIQELIVKGTFGELASSKTPQDMERKRALIPTITCDGEPYIVVEGRGIAMWNTIEDFTYQSKTAPIDLRVRGLKPVSRAQYQAVKRPSARPQSEAKPVAAAPRG